LWTYYNHCSDKNSEIIHWQTTNIKKAKLFWLIKAGKLEKIISTGSQIFRDFRNLKKITIYFPHRRYYKHQKDPRYHTYEVVKKLIKLYNCELETKYDYNI
jgi:primosomal protein N'